MKYIPLELDNDKRIKTVRFPQNEDSEFIVKHSDQEGSIESRVGAKSTPHYIGAPDWKLTLITLITGQNGHSKTELLNHIREAYRSESDELIFFLKSNYEPSNEYTTTNYKDFFCHDTNKVFLNNYLNREKMKKGRFTELYTSNQIQGDRWGDDFFTGEQDRYTDFHRDINRRHNIENPSLIQRICINKLDDILKEPNNIDGNILDKVIYTSIYEKLEKIKLEQPYLYIELALNFYKIESDRIRKNLHNNDPRKIEECILDKIGKDPRDIINDAIKDKMLGFQMAELTEQYPQSNLFKCQIVDSKGIKFDLYKLSSGESLVFQMLAVWQFSFFNTNNIKDLQVKVILLDEPDKHLDPNLCKLFMKTLREEFVDKGIQVIMTTHDTNTIAFAEDSEIFTCKKNDQNKIDILPCSKGLATLRLTKNVRDINHLSVKVYTEAINDALFYEHIYQILQQYSVEIRQDGNLFWRELEVANSWKNRVLSQRVVPSFHSTSKVDTGADGGLDAVIDTLKRDVISHQKREKFLEQRRATASEHGKKTQNKQEEKINALEKKAIKKGQNPEEKIKKHTNKDTSSERLNSIRDNATKQGRDPEKAVENYLKVSRNDRTEYTVKPNKIEEHKIKNLYPYSAVKSFGIIDRDFGNNPKNTENDIFITNRYALENFMYDPFIMTVVLNENFVKSLKNYSSNMMLSLLKQLKDNINIKNAREIEQIKNILKKFFAITLEAVRDSKTETDNKVYRDYKDKLDCYGIIRDSEKLKEANSAISQLLKIHNKEKKEELINKINILISNQSLETQDKMNKAMKDDFTEALLRSYDDVDNYLKAPDAAEFNQEIKVIFNKNIIISFNYPRVFLYMRGKELANALAPKFFMQDGGDLTPKLLDLVLQTYEFPIPYDLAETFFELNAKLRWQMNSIIKPEIKNYDTNQLRSKGYYLENDVNSELAVLENDLNSEFALAVRYYLLERGIITSSPITNDQEQSVHIDYNNIKEKIIQEHSEFEGIITDINDNSIGIKGDGNCLFNSILVSMKLQNMQFNNQAFNNKQDLRYHLANWYRGANAETSLKRVNVANTGMIEEQDVTLKDWITDEIKQDIIELKNIEHYKKIMPNVFAQETEIKTIAALNLLINQMPDSQYRTDTINLRIEHRDLLWARVLSCITDPIVIYANLIEIDSVWGRDVDIQCLTKSLDVQISVHQDREFGNSQNKIALEFRNNNHFQLHTGNLLDQYQMNDKNNASVQRAFDGPKSPPLCIDASMHDPNYSKAFDKLSADLQFIGAEVSHNAISSAYYIMENIYSKNDNSNNHPTPLMIEGEPYIKPQSNAKTSINFNNLLYKSTISFKSLDFMVDTFRFINEPNVENVQKTLRDIIHLQSILGGNNMYSMALSSIDITNQLYKGEIQEAGAQAITTLGYMALPTMLSFTGLPYLGFAYGAMIAGYTGYHAVGNAYSLYSEYSTVEWQLKSAMAYKNLYEALSNSPLQYTYNFASNAKWYDIKANIIKLEMEKAQVKQQLEAKGEFGEKLYEHIYVPMLEEKYGLLQAKHVTLTIGEQYYEHCISVVSENIDDHYSCYNMEQEIIDHVVIYGDSFAEIIERL